VAKSKEQNTEKINSTVSFTNKDLYLEQIQINNFSISNDDREDENNEVD
jgi:hypothetical protein